MLCERLQNLYDRTKVLQVQADIENASEQAIIQKQAESEYSSFNQSQWIKSFAFSNIRLIFFAFL